MKDQTLVTVNRQDRLRILNAARAMGVRVLHDSGGQLLVLEAGDKTDELLKRLPKQAKAVAPDKLSEKLRKTLSPSEELFASALKLRLSKKYQDMKAAQIPGESEEEQLLVTGSCVTEE